MDILGEGIDAIDKTSLLNEVSCLNSGDVAQIEVSRIIPGPYQPRGRKITPESVQELAESIMLNGLLQPVVVRPTDKNEYIVIAGERRLKACQLAGCSKIPAIVKNVSEREAYAIALIENIQREQLNILDEANGLLKLKTEYGISNQELAISISKPRSTVTNLIRLSENLCQFGKDNLLNNKIDYGHARAVLSLKCEIQEEALRDVIINKLSVRSLENKVRQNFYPKINDIIDEISTEDHFTSKLILNLENRLSRKVKVAKTKKGSYRVSLEFKNEWDVKDFLKKT
jgi:ParB family chromosome partitioning protein